jgi:hypothetical protein
MYLRKNDANKLIRDQIEELITSLSKKNEFLGSLLGGDDWSFVIKVQTLIEAAVTQSILAQIGDERIKSTIELMPLIGDGVSKLALAKELSIMTSEQRRFVKQMATLRNKLAHRIENTNFSFDRHIQSLSAASIKDWKVSITWYSTSPDAREFWLGMSQTQPRSAIYLAAYLLVAILTIDGTMKDTTRKIDEIAAITTQSLIEGSFGATE